jgi:hypothetical protein
MTSPPDWAPGSSGDHRVRRAGGRTVLTVVLVVVLMLAVARPLAAAAKPLSARDRAILAAGVIQRSDAPTGWIAHKQGAGTGPQFKGIAACKQLGTVVNAALLTVPHRLSSEFSDPTSGSQTTVMANTAYAFKDVAAADSYVAAYRGTNVPTCFSQSAQRAVKGSLHGLTATINVSPLTNLAGLGDGEVGYSVTLTVSAQGQQQTFYDDLVAVRVGRAVLGFNFQNLGAELPAGPAIIRQTTSRVAPLAT